MLRKGNVWNGLAVYIYLGVIATPRMRGCDLSVLFMGVGALAIKKSSDDVITLAIAY